MADPKGSSKLASLAEQERALRSQLGQVRRNYAATALHLVNENLPEDIGERGAVTPFKAGDLEIPRDGWECATSPIGICVYHPETDCGDCDDCLYCHQPYERK